MTSMIRRRPLAVIRWLVRQYSSSATRQFVRRPSWRCAHRGGHVSDICTLPSVTRCRSIWPMAAMTTRTISATTTTSAIYRTSRERHRTRDSWSAMKVKVLQTDGEIENVRMTSFSRVASGQFAFYQLLATNNITTSQRKRKFFLVRQITTVAVTGVVIRHVL